MNKLGLAGIAIAIAATALSGCSRSSDSATRNDQATTDSQLARYQANQPVPSFDWSQYRQTVIDVESAEVHGVATTTFFYNMGSQKPISSCPSLGFPVAVTAQLTNPTQISYGAHPGGGSDAQVIEQAEPNGVYTGGSDGTYVVCIAPGGAKYMQYWEGDVNTIGGPAHWDQGSEQIVLDGAPTVKVNTK